MNTQIHELKRLLAAVDSSMSSAEAQMLIRDSRKDIEHGRREIAKAIKIVVELDTNLVGGALLSDPATSRQAGLAPQAWLDVQSERRRQIDAEGWTTENDDKHGGGQMARAAACYALAGSCPPNDETAALLVDLAWPWTAEWWKPTTSRRDLVKAAALILSELERLDRATAAQGGV
ncbi:hypothetical protein [Pseudomonas nitroreducens]|uniref:hypothetical protein n=1 Tax=Pseudomonas nitroreducens TaxID=46680 RepID=UPI002D7F40DF|nr:hypothetical protein [Pseudomonas nitroreducens]